jgi:hypothetical protein
MIHSQNLLSLPQIFPVEVGPTSDSSIPNQGASGTSMQVRNLRFETEVGVTCAPKRVSLVTHDGCSSWPRLRGCLVLQGKLGL